MLIHSLQPLCLDGAARVLEPGNLCTRRETIYDELRRYSSPGIDERGPTTSRTRHRLTYPTDPMAGRPLRSTRSGATFSPWGEPITSDADFEELLQQSLAQQYECTPPMPSTAEPYPPPSPTSAYAASPPALPAMDASSAPAWTPPAPPTLTTATRKQTRSKQKGHANRRQKRTKTKASAAYQPRDGAGDRHIRVAQASPTTLASEKLPIASTGYIGTCGGASTELCRLDELAALGFEIHPWDGRSAALPLALKRSIHRSSPALTAFRRPSWMRQDE